MTLRIAVAGFQHETNSFSPIPTELPQFEMADSWPGLLTGPEVIAGTRGLNLPIAGFAAAAEAHGGIEPCPLLWCAAEPQGLVTDAAFDAITGRLLEGLAAAGPVDGVYLDLHGAMLTQSFDDGEAEILRRVREVLGESVPIAISLDMHAHLTPQIVAQATSVCIFRTYPHLDMAATGARCLAPLLAAIAGASPVSDLRHGPYLIPMHAQFTGADPMRALYAAVEQVERDSKGDIRAEFAAGFTAGDTEFMGPAILVQGHDRGRVGDAADRLFDALLSAEDRFDAALPDARTAVRQAMSLPPGRPVIIADVQDNAGGGGSSDTTGLLRALLDEGAEGAILGVLADAEVAALAHARGVGATLAVDLGGKSGQPGDRPLPVSAVVEALSDGQVTYEGEMYGGGIAQIGPTALLHIRDVAADIRVVVSSLRNQCLDRGYFRHIGVDPEAFAIVCVKSTVHFRADFSQMAQAVIAAAAPGNLLGALDQVGFRSLRAGVRLGPMGPENG